ncbi:MAG: winged helix-turn-helix transcriptional regulator [Candidatus Thorarchaeota archaeon]
MDLIDKGIFYALDANCRISYEALAKQFNISANAIKKRVSRLQATGFIQRFSIWLSLGMIDAEQVVVFITMDGKQNDEDLIKTIGANPMVHRLASMTCGKIIIFGEYVGASGLAELSRFFRGLDHVTHVEIHTLLTEKGNKMDFTPLQLSVLRFLRKDARMSIVQLAKESGLTARTIRRVLNQLGGNSGSIRAFVIHDDIHPENRPTNEPVHFRTIWNLNAGGNISFVARISYEENRGDPKDVVGWLRKIHPKEHLYSYASAIEPIIFSNFIVENIGEMERISQSIKSGPMVEKIQTLVLYPVRHYPGLRELQLDALLQAAPSK